MSNSHTTNCRLIVARDVDGLHLSNIVDSKKLKGSYFEHCPNLVMENSVIARPQIFAFILRNDADEPALFGNNIFTDMLEKKAVQNINLFQIDRRLDGVRMESNAFHALSFTHLERHMAGTYTAFDRPDIFINPLFADPVFKGVVDLIDAGVEVGDFSADRLMHSDVPLEFETFFATNPDIVQRDIGLRREPEADFETMAGTNPLTVRFKADIKGIFHSVKWTFGDGGDYVAASLPPVCISRNIFRHTGSVRSRKYRHHCQNDIRRRRRGSCHACVIHMKTGS